MNALVLTLVHPLQALCTQHFAECAFKGIHWTVVQGRRDPEKQLELYARGREFHPGTGWNVTDKKAVVTNALPEQSAHCRGAAYDIAIFTDGKIDWNATASYREAGALGKSLGLIWGGDFNTMHHGDLGHFELKDWKSYPMEENV